MKVRNAGSGTRTILSSIGCIRPSARTATSATISTPYRHPVDSIRKERGLLINGQPFFSIGANRHQDHPYVGYALPPSAHYRDAFKLRDAGFTRIEATIRRTEFYGCLR